MSYSYNQFQKQIFHLDFKMMVMLYLIPQE